MRELLGHTLRIVRSEPAILLSTLLVFLPILAVQLAAPSLMRGRTSPVPGGALLGTLLVLLLLCILAPLAFRLIFRRLTGRPSLWSVLRGQPRKVAALVTTALLLSLLGQSLLAGLGELLAVVRSSDVGFVLDYRSYLIVTVLAYVWNVFVMALLAVALSVLWLRLEDRQIIAVRTSIAWPRWASLLVASTVLAAFAILSLKLAQHF